MNKKIAVVGMGKIALTSIIAHQFSADYRAAINQYKELEEEKVRNNIEMDRGIIIVDRGHVGKYKENGESYLVQPEIKSLNTLNCYFNKSRSPKEYGESKRKRKFKKR